MDPVNVLYPAKRVKLTFVEVDVYPVRFKHIRKFSTQIVAALGAIGGTTAKKGASAAEIAQIIKQTLSPLLLTSLMDLLEECCNFLDQQTKIDDLAHWDIAPVVEAFIEQNFLGEDKIRPWIQAIQNLKSTAESLPSQVEAQA